MRSHIATTQPPRKSHTDNHCTVVRIKNQKIPKNQKFSIATTTNTKPIPKKDRQHHHHHNVRAPQRPHLPLDRDTQPLRYQIAIATRNGDKHFTAAKVVAPHCSDRQREMRNGKEKRRQTAATHEVVHAMQRGLELESSSPSCGRRQGRSPAAG
ncbi:Hypothetical predicted protein [Olea europaea subsp. europaea]|uniref:Uncharacterized protein n=1 Tax=Olea europaea subsp. europaea TaxID=158383 RepID=A0A8S0Q488_OLEEU|nr:Hypothetical predicted protein [Olea europaea subsp. europaea]